MELSADARITFDAMSEGITIIDTDCRIVFANTAYRKFLERETGAEIDKLEGRLLCDLRPGARLPEVIKTGKPILHAPRVEAEDIYFVNMYPIYQNGTLSGALSVVTFIEQAYDFRTELEAYEHRSQQVLRRINKANGARFTFSDVVAVSPNSVAVKELARKIAATDATVLLNSESGTGKEVYAQAIHNASPRSKGVFVAINCANFNANILESELFGYMEGAFTGAKKGGKIGLLEAASGGTIFFDEISEMDLGLQAKLLRVLQERHIRPVGGIHEVEIDVRVIAACNADLSRYVEEGKFRKDLYYRLSSFPVRIPPLRERPEDIPLLTASILEEFSRKLKRQISISNETVSYLLTYEWPGNVRELRNVLEFASYLAPAGQITAAFLPTALVKRGVPGSAVMLAEQVRRFERETILQCLQVNGSDLAGKKKTAVELHISLASLYQKIRNVPEQ